LLYINVLQCSSNCAEEVMNFSKNFSGSQKHQKHDYYFQIELRFLS
jgi:hypothetical protein